MFKNIFLKATTLSLGCPARVLLLTNFTCTLSVKSSGLSFSISVDFDDETPVQTHPLTDSSTQITKFYAAGGIYNVTATVAGTQLKVTPRINGKYCIHSRVVNRND